jgi:hypothetical protein
VSLRMVSAVGEEELPGLPGRVPHGPALAGGQVVTGLGLL